MLSRMLKKSAHRRALYECLGQLDFTPYPSRGVVPDCSMTFAVLNFSDVQRKMSQDIAKLPILVQQRPGLYDLLWACISANERPSPGWSDEVRRRNDGTSQMFLTRGVGVHKEKLAPSSKPYVAGVAYCNLSRCRRLSAELQNYPACARREVIEPR